MKKIIFLLFFFSLLMSCKNELAEKPKNIINKNKMAEIIYDITILEAIQTQYITTSDSMLINPKKIIFKKHKIDSLQFIQNNTYYASNIEVYEKIVTDVKNRLNKEINKIEK